MRLKAVKTGPNAGEHLVFLSEDGQVVDPYVVMENLMTRDVTIVKKVVTQQVISGQSIQSDGHISEEHLRVRSFPRELLFELHFEDEFTVTHRVKTIPFAVLQRMKREEYEAYVAGGVIPDWAQRELESGSPETVEGQ